MTHPPPPHEPSPEQLPVEPASSQPWVLDSSQPDTVTYEQPVFPASPSTPPQVLMRVPEDLQAAPTADTPPRPTEMISSVPGGLPDPDPDDDIPTVIDVPRFCPGCGNQIAGHEQFCENCGLPLVPTAETPPPDQSDRPSAVTRPHSRAHVPATQACAECGGEIDADGYCLTCGARATDPRDRFEESPADWIAGVCDRGIRHERNEDAMALAVGDDNRAIIVVCDGVSTSEDSHVASLAGARAARDLLLAQQSTGVGTAESQDAAAAADLIDATVAANAAVVASTRPESPNAASCTIVSAIVLPGRVHYAHLGDSRVYWFGADGGHRLLTLDDSVAQARIAMGVPREEAETGFQAHAITRWLGRDSEDIIPHTGTFRLPGPGWLLVCSDGLWNYASEPDALWAQLAATIGPDPTSPDPLKVARSLVAWANQQGGRDNITVALALVQSSSAQPEPTPSEE